MGGAGTCIDGPRIGADDSCIGADGSRISADDSSIGADEVFHLCRRLSHAFRRPSRLF